MRGGSRGAKVSQVAFIYRGLCKNTMEIIDIHYKPSKEVKSGESIYIQAQAIANMIDEKDYGNRDVRDAHAIAHAQVSEEPKAFFVLSEEMGEQFGGRTIVNPVILETPEEVEGAPNKHKMEEACMSFPHRREKNVERYAMIVVSYSTLHEEGRLESHKKQLVGLPSQVFQHECDHIRGENIYFDGPKV